MNITMTSTDSKEAVNAALSDLAPKENAPGEKPKEEAGTPVENPDSEEPKEAAKKEGEEEAKPKKKNGFKERMAKARSQRDEALQRAAYWEGIAKSSVKPQEAQATEAKHDGKPNPEKFETQGEYFEALADWKSEQKLAKFREEQEQTQRREKYQSKESALSAKIDAFRAKTDDFDEVLEAVEHIPMSMAVREAILESEDGPALMYELGRNPKEYARICQLSAIQAAKEIGKIEARLEKPSEEKKEIKTTKAPKPPTPVSGTATVSTKKPDEMNYQEYKAWYAKTYKTA